MIPPPDGRVAGLIVELLVGMGALLQPALEIPSSSIVSS